SNPNQGDQSAPIAITVTEFDDPHSTFIGLQQPAVTFPINDTEFKTVANGWSSVTLTMGAPPTPYPSFDFFRFDAAISIPTALSRDFDSLAYTPVNQPPPLLNSEWNPSVRSDVDSVILHRGTLVHEVIDADGSTIFKEALPDGAIRDVPKLLRQYPDGRHRILRFEPGETQPRVLIDVFLRDGKPDSGDAGRSEVPRSSATVSPQPAEATLPRSGERPVDRATSEASPTADSDNDLPYAALGALCCWLPQHDWEASLDELLTTRRKDRLSKPARIARRLRRRLAAR
ncbi:MAG: hypothetical protein ACT4QC_02275, partial [Planctomycetaceae bacterium]